MPISLPTHLLPGVIHDERETHSIIRWTAWLYLGLAVAMFAFEEAFAGYMNASDWSPDAASSKTVAALVIVTPPIALMLSRSRAAALVSLVLAGLLAAALGWIYLLFARGPPPIATFIDPWMLGIAVFAVGWIASAALSCRALWAAILLKQHDAAGGATAAVVRTFE